MSVGLNLAKSVFQVHRLDEARRPVVRRRLRLGQVLGFFVKLPGCLAGMEAFGSAHYWARKRQALLLQGRLPDTASRGQAPGHPHAQ